MDVNQLILDKANRNVTDFINQEMYKEIAAAGSWDIQKTRISVAELLANLTADTPIVTVQYPIPLYSIKWNDEMQTGWISLPYLGPLTHIHLYKSTNKGFLFCEQLTDIDRRVLIKRILLTNRIQ